MPGQIGSKSIEIDTHFEQYFMPGQIRPVELGVNPLR